MGGNVPQNRRIMIFCFRWSRLASLDAPFLSWELPEAHLTARSLCTTEHSRQVSVFISRVFLLFTRSDPLGGLAFRDLFREKVRRIISLCSFIEFDRFLLIQADDEGRLVLEASVVQARDPGGQVSLGPCSAARSNAAGLIAHFYSRIYAAQREIAADPGRRR